jgi:hypothetical protein
MPHPDMATLLTDQEINRGVQVRGSADRRTRRAATSCSFDRDQFVLYIMQLHQSGMHRAVFKVNRRGLQHVRAEFFPGICFSEDRVSQRAQ